MAVRRIVQLGEPELRTKGRDVTAEDFASGAVKRVVTDLRDTLKGFQKMHGKGRGIAAPQIGEGLRIIYIDYEGVTEPLAMFNPAIDEASGEKFEVWDSCFSYWGVVFKVSRHARVTVSYQDQAGRKQSLRASGDLAELLQHEIEHLDGVLAIDQLVPPGLICSILGFEATGARSEAQA